MPQSRAVAAFSRSEPLRVDTEWLRLQNPILDVVGRYGVERLARCRSRPTALPNTVRVANDKSDCDDQPNKHNVGNFSHA